jgi:hypothetical protein
MIVRHCDDIAAFSLPLNSVTPGSCRLEQQHPRVQQLSGSFFIVSANHAEWT